VNGAGAGKDEQPRVLSVEDGGDFVAGVEDGGRGRLADGALFLKEYRGENDFGPFDAEIFCGVEHGWFPCGAHPGSRPGLRNTEVEIGTILLRIYQLGRRERIQEAEGQDQH
jgi:hypothetical protein